MLPFEAQNGRGNVALGYTWTKAVPCIAGSTNEN